MNTAEKKRWIEQRLLAARRESEADGHSRSPARPLEPIAIVGVSGYFPQCLSVQAFWRALAGDDSLIEEIPQSRFDWRRFHDADTGTGDLRGRWGGFVPRIRDFDPAFFQMSSAEAEYLDPRQRLLLMSAYHTLEDAGQAPGALRGSHIGVFIAEEINEYLQILARHDADLEKTYMQANSMIANRISYFFDFRGPSEVVNTMCSGAAVALHRAVQALRSGDIEQALVGAANLILTPDFSLFLSSVEQLSPGQTVHSFGPGADGFVRAEGVASLLLKPLSRAEADGDAIYALIKHSAVSFNGRGGLSIFSPNTAAHVELIERCYREADLDPRRLGYIEAQGMGTPVADIAEWEACKRALHSLSEEQGLKLAPGSCRISTLKPFCGHMHAASALGALFKIIGSLQTDTLYRIFDFDGLHPDLEDSGQVCRPLSSNEAWEPGELPRLAGLHAFGSGGNNAHLLIEEYRSQETGFDAKGPCVIPVSAHSPVQLRAMLQTLADHMRQRGNCSLYSVARTLQQGRDAMPCRIAFVAEDMATWLRQLDAYLDGRAVADLFEGRAEAGSGELPTGDAALQAAAWVRGEFDRWQAWSGACPHLHLPGYQFDLKAYWVAEQPATASVSAQDPFAATRAGIAEMEDLAARLLCAQLQILDGFADPDAIRKQIGHLPGHYQNWWEESLRQLTGRGYLVRDADGLGFQPAAEGLEALWREWRNARGTWAEDAYLSVLLALLEATLPSLPAILQGETSPTELLYADASADLVEAVYRDHPIADYLNERLAGALLKALRARLQEAPDARIRILEIGAGGGATSRSVLRRLQPFRQHLEEYCLTDHDGSALAQVERRFGAEYPFLRTRRFDVQRSPEEQSLVSGSYDFVIASHVLHVTRNIRVSLHNARALLGDQGQLLLIEMSDSTLLGHLSLGLLDGWWRYEDGDLRIPGSPALLPATWARLLREQGFEAVSFPAESAHAIGQQLVVAVSDGRPHESTGAVTELPEVTAQHGLAVEQGMRTLILDHLSRSLKMPARQIGLDDAFSDLGLDSMLGIKLVKSINQALQLGLSSTDLFDHGTVNALARYLSIIANPETVSEPIGIPRVPPSTATATSPGRAAPGEPADRDVIAIIGMSGRFADCEDVHALWEHLAAADELVGDVSRWDLRSVHAEAGRDTETYCKRGSFLHDIDLFDPLFFKISGMDAVYMDPNQRLFLEEAWNALEDAGYVGPGLEGTRCGVYVGCGAGDYEQLFPKDAPVQSVWGRMSAILASRIAYYLDLTGPAVPVDTACSSSLVAIHLACQGLWSGETRMALAGGVFVSSTPKIFALEAAGMFSPSGRCHTFDARADGTVPGEGVGVLVLKRVSQALTDGDHIHGVIRGSGINQDGKTNGITAPSAQSQERLQRGIYDDFGITADSISLVEAHGTGTKLGDPIEIAALSRAFRQDTGRQNFCAIGSIKTNIGHTQFAAGVAGVIKVLLALKHRCIPPSLNFQSANPGIDFDASPFFVNTVMRDWDSPPGIPRRAAVSSFGASGTNAHLVIEEAPDQLQPSPSRPGYLLLVSARTLGQLHDQARQLLAHVHERGDAFDLGHACFTLIAGRRRFAHRLAGVVSSPEQLIGQLQDWLETGSSTQLLYGEVAESESPQGPALSRLAGQCLTECRQSLPVDRYLDNLAVLADLLVQGYPVAYEPLFGHGFRRVSLPTYPFERKRYWLAEAVPARLHQGTSPVRLHPLLHLNSSVLAALRFESEFQGEEFFLKDHLVKGRKVLPGVAYLEMAREALARVCEPGVDWRLKNLVWAAPIVLEQSPCRVGLELYPSADGQIEFEFRSLAEGADPVTHARGLAYRAEASGSPQSLDLDALRDATRGGEMQAARLYRMFSSLGIDYGPGHRGVKCLYRVAGQVLSELELPAVLTEGAEDFVLHPSLLDAAVQSCLAMTLGGETDREAPRRLSLPFALDELQVFRPCSARMWAWIREHEGTGDADQLQKLDLDGCAEDGSLCFRMRGLSFRAYEQAGAAVEDGLLLMRPVWREAVLSGDSQQHAPAQRMLFNACETPLESAIALQAGGPDFGQRLTQGLQQVFQTLKTGCASQPGSATLIQVMVPSKGPQHLFACLSRMFKTATLEHPALRAQLIEVEAQDTRESMLQCLEDSSRVADDVHVRYRNGRRELMQWEGIPMGEATPAFPWKEGGVYLITGGAGGLGRLFADEILERTGDAVVILSGRSALTADLQATLDKLAAGRGQIHYVPADLGDPQQVEGLIQDIEQTQGGLDGILHAAGVLRDSYLRDKTPEQLHEVLAPKVSGLWWLDQASAHLQLDFLILFSSVSAVFASPGQADYAAANAFMDEFAHYRNQRVRASERHGHTLSINWPLWKDGGMQVDEATRSLIGNATGLSEMAAADGFEALARAFASGLDQVAVLHGRIPVMREKLATRSAPVRPSESHEQIPADGSSTTVEVLLKRTASNILMVPVEDIDSDTELSDYGFDSISLTQFANRLSAENELALMPTVFFEHPTIAKFARYLSQVHPQAFAAGVEPPPTPAGPVEAPAPVSRSVSYLRPRAPRREPAPAQQAGVEDNRVAVIGMSGCFPMAGDLDAFWNNLKEGRDCIQEIPEARWDWRALFGDPHREAGKTDVKWGGFIDGVDQFDPLFFGISPHEAEMMDPQQRLLMTCVWQTLEEAGYSAERLAGTRTGIFAAVGSSSYPKLLADAGVPVDGFTATGVTPSVGPNRMSFFMDWHGPSEPVETACSSSLVAIHRALQAIASDTCDMAVVGGVNTIVSPEPHVSFSKAGMLSKDGRCKTFSTQADGYVRGEGVAFLLLKKLPQAQADGDHIHGIILGSAENHGGRANSLTAPNPLAQSEVIQAAQRNAGIDPRSLGYIEAHGTGTALGDPVEINGLKMAFEALYADHGLEPAARPHCALGSVKSNIGHLELAAGVAGVIKVLLQMKHRTLVQSLHCDELNPYIDLAGSPFSVQRARSEWPSLYDPDARPWPRRAGVSSFGFGGVNAHVVLEEYVDCAAQAESRSEGPAAIVLSAKSPRALDARVRALHDFLQARLQAPETSDARQWEDIICRALADLLSVDPAELDVRQPLEDFGVEPYHLPRLAERLRDEHDLSLDAAALLACASVRELAALVRGDDERTPVDQQVPRLRDLAYTLQSGREAMGERLGFVASSLQDLWEKLKALVAGETGACEVYRGQPKRDQDALAMFESDEALRSAVDSWFDQGKLQSILGLWVKGLKVDWQRLYEAPQPRRLSLPTYPFERERYWVSAGGESAPAGVQPLHPLLHENVSDLSEMRFASRFSGQEFFLQDHRVQGEKVLPGAAYLEMVRAAVERSAAQPKPQAGGIALANLVWARPLRLNGAGQLVHTSLNETEDGELGFEVHQVGGNPAQTRMLSQGIARWFDAAQGPELDLDGLRERIAHKRISAAQVYQVYQAAGLDYGASQRGIESLSIGQGEVLARLVLPEKAASSASRFVLHPSLLDAAIQTSIGLVPGLWDGQPDEAMPLALPYALDGLQVWGRCSTPMWAWTRESASGGQQARKLDIDLCDEQGRVCVRIEGLLSRVLDAPLTSEQGLVCHPVWAPVAAPEAGDPDYARHLVLHIDDGALHTEALNGRMAEAEVRGLASRAATPAARFRELSGQVFETVREVLALKPTEPVLLQVSCVGGGDGQAVLAGITGLLRTATREHPMLHGQFIAYEVGETAQGLADKLRENRRRPAAGDVRYQDGRRQVSEWREAVLDEAGAALPWKHGGVYLITGGLGGLGRLFAMEIASRVGEVTLVLAGRSSLDEDMRLWLQGLEAPGARLVYREVDVCQAEAVEDLVQGIVSDFGALNGILHAAGVFHDRFIIHKTAEEFDRVLGPKVLGVENLDRASRDLDLDLFVLFSSVTGPLGNPGQADYAAANAFMDTFAEARNRQAAKKLRRGRSLSINWPLWEAGGMRADSQTEELLASTTGMRALPTSVALHRFYQALASGHHQLMVLAGDVQRLRRFVGLADESTDAMAQAPTVSDQPIPADGNIADFARQTLARAVKLAPERILDDTAFEQYGIDSVMQISIINELEQSLGTLPKTLLFEYASLRELVDYFTVHHADAFAGSASKTGAPKADKPVARRRRLRKRQPASGTQLAGPRPGEREDIAIIGIAGRYPRSENLDALWENLKAGNNCIGPPPPGRWRDSLLTAVSGEVPADSDRPGGYIENIHCFDHGLFGIAEDQVLTLSPELRLFLEVVWETLESGGYAKSQLQDLQQRAGRGVGVYVGSMYDQYPWTAPSPDRAVLQSNGSEWQIANRVSHFFGLTGPSMAVNSACSSSLTAIHLACEALRQGQAAMAIAGGVNLTLDPSKYQALRMTELLGSGDQSKSFGLGDGYIPGEGVGAVLLKPLSRALEEGDRVTALIKSSYLNHGGGRQMYSVPDPKQETALMLESMRQSGIDPDTIGYVESAANGSALGDPIEFSALSKAFGESSERQALCALGSVKSNLGHLEAASGISQLSKVCLQLQHRTLVPTLHASPVNPAIAIDGSAFRLQTTCEEWQTSTDPHSGEPLPRRSMINSIGAGGSYANLIVEEYPAPPRVSPAPQSDLLFAFSAKTHASLLAYLERLRRYLETGPALADLAYSLCRLNHNLERRAVLVARSRDQLQQALSAWLESAPESPPASVFVTPRADRPIPALEDCRAAMEQGRLADAARCWVEGGEFDIYEAIEPVRGTLISLPGYCFDHDKAFRFTADGPAEEQVDDDAFLNGLYEKLSRGEWSEDEAAARLDLPGELEEILWPKT